MLLNVLQYQPFLIKPNNHELGEIFQVTLNTREEVVPYAKKLQEKGAHNVLVSMAGQGAVLVDALGAVHMLAAPKGKLVNAVGGRRKKSMRMHFVWESLLAVQVLFLSCWQQDRK